MKGHGARLNSREGGFQILLFPRGFGIIKSKRGTGAFFAASFEDFRQHLKKKINFQNFNESEYPIDYDTFTSYLSVLPTTKHL